MRQTFFLPQEFSRAGFGDWAGAWVQRVRPDALADAKHAVLAKLAAYPGGGSLDDEDRLFAEHTWLVEQARDQKIDKAAPVDLWQYHLSGATTAAEWRLGVLIHKGAPYYNCGLCLFLANDFEGSYYFLAQGAREEARSRSVAEITLLSGDHALSRQILVEPLVPTVFPGWTADYTLITGQALDVPEFIALMQWMFPQPTDAIEVILGLHRLRSIHGKDNNASTRSQRANAVRDLHHVIESLLREHCTGIKQFYDRMKLALHSNGAAEGAFDTMHTWFTNNVPAANRETAGALDLVVAEAIRAFGLAASQAERAGIAAYTAVRVRNSVLHRNYEQSVVFTNPATSTRLCGWALATCRTVKHRSNGTL